MSEVKYKRVLLKLSGEALAGDNKTGVYADVIGKICDEIKKIVDLGVQVGIVVGGRKLLERKIWTSDGKNYIRLYGNACNNYEWFGTSRYT